MCGAKSASQEPPALSLGDLKILVLDEADRMLSEASSSEAVFCGVKGKPQGGSLAEFRFGLLFFYFFGGWTILVVNKKFKPWWPVRSPTSAVGIPSNLPKADKPTL